MFNKNILLEKSKIKGNVSSLNLFTKWIIRFILIFFILSQFNCAIFERKNLVLVNAVEDNLVPEDSTYKILAAPFYIPLGIIGGVLDVFLLHPISVIPKAANTTIEDLWKPRELGYVTRMGAIPFTMILTPFYFGISWSYYWLFESGSRLESEGGVSTTENWIKNLKKAKNKQEDAMIVSDLLNECYQHINSDGVSEVLIPILKDESIEESDYNIGISCISSTENYGKEYEDFILEMYYKKPDSFFSYLRFFELTKSKKGSELLVNELFSKKRKSKNIPEIIQTIYRIGDRKQIEKIENKLRE
ncbi:MAG: hypothetical protein KDK36_04880 [Leptospiraceae bacterium]|nr:hypothetical protein [Leptospiraceae bacterium]